MRPGPILVFLLSIVMVGSCKKDQQTDGCFPGAPTIRQITNQPAIIKVTATIYSVYLVEQGSIDTKLIPCNLASEFVQNNLQVIISGKVKSRPQEGGLCCSSNLVITSISR